MIFSFVLVTCPYKISLQVSQLRAELDDVQYGHRDKLRAVTRQLQELGSHIELNLNETIR